MAKKNKLNQIQKGARRAKAVEAGAYDGRFGKRVFTDRKKQASKRACRGKVNY